MRVAIVVHGRFHAFDLARALLQRGHEVTIFTNYPRWAAKRLGVPGECVRSAWLHGALARAAQRARDRALPFYPEAQLHTVFGWWAAHQLCRERWDVVHSWSGVSEELLRMRPAGAPAVLLARGSAHIRAQARLLEEEEARTGVPLDRPSPWMIRRECREYALADAILVPSSFARATFSAEGIPAKRVGLLPLAADSATFRLPATFVEQRIRRILVGDPIRVLFVGALSLQKGLQDMAEVIRALSGGRFTFRLVGPLTREARTVLAGIRHLAEIVPKQPQRALPVQFAWADLFFFPTIQDGFAQVLAQAQAAALPILATTNSAGPDLVEESKTGWIVPIRSPRDAIERLRVCDIRRGELAAMIRRVAHRAPRDWADVAADFEVLCGSFVRRTEGATERLRLAHVRAGS